MFDEHHWLGELDRVAPDLEADDGLLVAEIEWRTLTREQRARVLRELERSGAPVRSVRVTGACASR